MRTDLPHVLCHHAFTREQGGVDLASRRIWNSRCFPLSAAASIANGHAFRWTPERFSGHRRFIRSAFAPTVFHGNEQLRAESGNRGRAGVSLLNRRCLNGFDESDSTVGKHGQAKAATCTRLRPLRVSSMPCYSHLLSRSGNSCEHEL